MSTRPLFDEVRVPMSLRVGAENDGWAIAKYLLKHERGGGSRAARAQAIPNRVRAGMSSPKSADSTGSGCADFTRCYSELQMAQTVLAATEYRTLVAQETSGATGSRSASILKLRGSELPTGRHRVRDRDRDRDSGGAGTDRGGWIAHFALPQRTCIDDLRRLVGDPSRHSRAPGHR